MSREVIIRIRDDIDGSEADETIAFAYRGTNYEIDLNNANVELFDKSMKQFVDVARAVIPEKRVVPAASRVKPVASAEVRAQRKEIRAWANANGMKAHDRGMISETVLQAFRDANPWVEILPGTPNTYSRPPKSTEPVAVTAQDADDGLVSVETLLTNGRGGYDSTARDPQGRPLSKKQRDIIRVWASNNGFEQAERGNIRREVLDAYFAAKAGGGKK